jgi:hypothetical protein
MTGSGGRGNAQNTATHTSFPSGGDVIKGSVVLNAREEEGEHERYCVPEGGEEGHAMAVFRWLVGRK